MKTKQSVLIILLLSVFVLLSSCAPAKTTFEGRKNRLEAYLLDRANGYDDVEAPNIYGLDDATKSELINGLAQDVVSGKEQILIDYLNEQWPTWRSAEGFLITYLDGLVSQAEKVLAEMPPVEIELTASTPVVDLMQFYRAFDNLLAESPIEHSSLFVIEDSLRYGWKYQGNSFYLLGVEMTLVDLTTSQFYQLQCDAKQISLKSIDSDATLYGHLSLDEVIHLLNEKSIVALLPTDAALPITINFSGSLDQSAEDVIVAIKDGAQYVTESELNTALLVGQLVVHQKVDDANPKRIYHLFLPLINE